MKTEIKSDLFKLVMDVLEVWRLENQIPCNRQHWDDLEERMAGLDIYFRNNKAVIQ